MKNFANKSFAILPFFSTSEKLSKIIMETIKNEQIPIKNDQNYLNGDDSAIRERRGVDRLKVLLFL